MFPIARLIERIDQLSAGRLTSTCLNGAQNLTVTRFAPLSHAAPEHVAFLAQSKYRDEARESGAGVLVVTADDLEAIWQGAPERPVIVTENPYAWFAWALQVMLEAGQNKACGVSPSAFIDPTAQVDPTAVIEAGAVVKARAQIGARTHVFSGAHVGEGTRVGEDCILYPNAVVYHGCTIGNRVILHSGAVIGADGFGFAPFKGEWVKIPQVGGVRIEDDVEIGANTTIDRGALDDTVIGCGTKMDNQIQIGHNGRIGKHTAMAACTGVAGSTKIGDHCIVGGAANINGHIAIPDGSTIGPATSIVHWDPSARIMMGFWPAQDKRAYERSAVLMMNLSKMRQQIKTLEAEIEALKRQKDA